MVSEGVYRVLFHTCLLNQTTEYMLKNTIRPVEFPNFES